MKRTIARIAILWGLPVGALLVGAIPGQASHEEFAVYENWAGAPTIRSDRWRGASDLGHERRREVNEDKLLMRFRREGGGLPGFFSNRLGFVNPFSVDQVEAEFRVRRLSVTGCDSSPSTARAVTIDLNKFNDGAGGPGDLTGDHFGRIRAERSSTDPDNTLTIRALIQRCSNPACSDAPAVVGPVTLGQVRVHKKFRLRLIWDSVGNRFLAGLDANPEVPLPYNLAHMRNANVPFGFIRIQHLPASCPEASGDAELEVREVRTNASAVIP